MKTTNNLSSCRPCCSTAGILLGIISGIIVAILFSLGLTPLILNGIWVAFSIGAAALVYVAVLAAVGSCSSCSALRGSLIKNLRCLLAGIFGTILTSIVLVSVALEISSIIISVLVGILTFFLIFLVASLISFLKSLIY